METETNEFKIPAEVPKSIHSLPKISNNGKPNPPEYGNWVYPDRKKSGKSKYNLEQAKSLTQSFPYCHQNVKHASRESLH